MNKGLPKGTVPHDGRCAGVESCNRCVQEKLRRMEEDELNNFTGVTPEEAQAELNKGTNNGPRLGQIGSSEFRTLDKIIRDTGVSSVIEKLTAPPETVRQHLDRIGVGFKVPMVNGRLVIEIDVAELEAAENPKEGQK
ncbi:hypothetical protein SEA_NOVASHARKS_83 [Gordonia phage NovaSharks]|uniref:Uncharacterized protein n=1 Tax=Gordonia phage NovaSharks TaxID=2927258 RepID=A0A9E7TV35_9CAUD|nr:hypothetical protein SEA_NOVASHARKS_83 [Gordonia phage NovaSharks]